MARAYQAIPPRSALLLLMHVSMLYVLCLFW
jgi:hypothetical protein